MRYIQGMVKLLQLLFGRLLPQPLDAHIELRVTQAVEQIDPRLKSFSNYPRAYRQAVTTATEYARKLAASLPDFIDLSPGRFAQDPLLHALFTDVEAIYSTVRESQQLKSYCSDHSRPQSCELYALMGMRRKEKTVFGRELNGEMVQQNVQQTLVYFEGHTLMLPSPDRKEFVAKLEQLLFDSLIKSLTEQIAQRVMQRRELEIERDTIVLRLRSVSTDETEQKQKLQAIRRELKLLDKEYSLGNYSALLDKFMDERQQYLRLERREVPIDMRGVMRESTERLAGHFVFHDLIGRDRRRWTLYPVRISVDELQQAMECRCDRERWMEI